MLRNCKAARVALPIWDTKTTVETTLFSGLISF
jgi:hypothetical protein